MLLDTHAVLWLLADDPRLGPQARSAISKASESLVSAASLWEIAIKSSLGKVRVPDDLPRRIVDSGLSWLPVTAAHSWAVRGVEGLPHRDPFDRLLLAQAATESVSFLTGDRVLLDADLRPGVKTVDASA